ncbi:aldo/keto reductase [Streptomyces angustmyceticus]|uniref:aldo/keto reductase n=1 Tax=Streptomyces angustmyceticus TaxID=285578 RepID=UPI003D9064BA
MVEGELLATCRDLGIAVVAYSPLGRGMLTGVVSARGDLGPDDNRRRWPGPGSPTRTSSATWRSSGRYGR